MTPLQLWQNSVRERLSVNTNYARQNSYSADILLMVSHESLIDLTTALAVIQTLTEALGEIAGIRGRLIPSVAATKALVRANELVSLNNNERNK